MKLLLISNSGIPLYAWCEKEIADFVRKNSVTFISAATVYDPGQYYKKAKARLSTFGIEVNHLDLNKNPEKIIDETEVFLIGGGNTYHLLSQLNEHNLLEKIKGKVLKGTPYIGISAGANIAGPNILTTNDWNIIGYKEFNGLNIVPFNINPHYIDPHNKKIFSGESKNDRIYEYLNFYKNPVVAMEEKTLLIINNAKITVGGFGKIKLFTKENQPKIFTNGDILTI